MVECDVVAVNTKLELHCTEVTTDRMYLSGNAVDGITLNFRRERSRSSKIKFSTYVNQITICARGHGCNKPVYFSRDKVRGRGGENSSATPVYNTLSYPNNAEHFR